MTDAHLEELESVREEFRCWIGGMEFTYSAYEDAVRLADRDRPIERRTVTTTAWEKVDG